jgi:hypothetical protein
LEAYTDQDTLVLEVDLSDGELVGERHCCSMKVGYLNNGKKKRIRKEKDRRTNQATVSRDQ